MDWKSKINTIVLVVVITLATTGIATTVYVSSIAEGQAALGKAQDVSLIGCKVYSISKTAESMGDFANDWEVKFAMEYSYEDGDGRMVQTREGVRTAFSATDSEAAVKAVVEKRCEADWAMAQARYGTIDQVIVEPKTNPVLSKVYDPGKKQWNSLSAVGP